MGQTFAKVFWKVAYIASTHKILSKVACSDRKVLTRLRGGYDPPKTLSSTILCDYIRAALMLNYNGRPIG